jgi:deazaflavin-dependent oxidoreductase (nitroreductase family)
VDGDPGTGRGTLGALASEDYLYLTTTGRVSGKPHRIEIWFALSGDTAYLLSGGGEGSDWVRNLRADPHVGVRIGDRDLTATARLVEAGTDEDALARRLVFDKYAPGYSGDLTDWRASAVPVALDLDEGS